MFYDLMSGALIWRDDSTPIRLTGTLRPIFAYCTSLMLGEPRVEFEEIWNEAQRLFPNWGGFRPESRESLPRLLEVCRRGDVSLTKCLRDFEEHLVPDDDHRTE